MISRIRWTQANEAIRFFQPHGGQLEFLAEVTKDGFIFVSGAGNGWGKSEMIAAILAAVMWPALAPDALRVPALIEWSHPKRARIYSTPAELEKIGSLQTAIERLFPVGRYTASNGHFGYPSVFVTDTGWVLDLFSYERDAAEAAGPNIGLQFFNEPPPEDIYKEAVARSRAGGFMFMMATSLDKNPWVVDGIFAKADGKDIRVRYGNSCENCVEHGVAGNLTHKQIMRILDQFDADEREARFSGKPLSISGRIFKLFDRRVHVKDIEPDGPVCRIQVTDPAISKPMFSIWAWANEAGYVHIYDESPDHNFAQSKDPHMTVDDYVTHWALKEGRTPIDRRIIDRRFAGQKRSLDGRTLRDEFRERGLAFEDSYSIDGAEKGEIETGIFKVNEYLRYNKEKPVDALNRPRLTISPKCVNIIAAIERWGRDPDTSKPLDNAYKDGCDTLRYLLMPEPKFEAASTWTPPSSSGYGVNNA